MKLNKSDDVGCIIIGTHAGVLVARNWDHYVETSSYSNQTHCHSNRSHILSPFIPS